MLMMPHLIEGLAERKGANKAGTSSVSIAKRCSASGIAFGSVGATRFDSMASVWQLAMATVIPAGLRRLRPGDDRPIVGGLCG